MRMVDNTDLMKTLRANSPLGLTSSSPKEKDLDPEKSEEESCPAFGFLRGIQNRALALEFRFRDGNSDYFSYSHLTSWRFNPSVGLLLKFTDDVVTLVLIHGSNLDALVKGSVNLTDRGLQRHRILWLREMDEDGLKRAGKGEPTIDRIEVAEFESHAELRDWLKKNAPAFVR
jgi:hypothetical protein